jgi:hydrogenase maturation protein HypF
VQGVGFRPFAVRLASDLAVTGHVSNTSRGVEIEIQGAEKILDAFARRLCAEAPPASLILDLTASEISPVPGEAGFEIRSSRTDPVSSVVIPPDIATCAACAAELADPADRRFGYPFLNCTDCGPRYSIIESVPYDRARTGMKFFNLCSRCEREFNDQHDRRFHAQPNACPACGPSLSLRGADGETLGGDPLEAARRALAEGKIVAVLGLGGFHLAVDAFSEAAVARLRRLKKRPAKPLAVMAASMDIAEKLVVMNDEARALLASAAAPVVILPRRGDSGIAPSVAPGQDTLGVFLPYTPLHRLLFAGPSPQALVMTSGNRSDEPMISTWEGAREKLLGVADLFLLHDRPIVHPVDDSVLKALGGLGPAMVRRARGYAPRPVPLPGSCRKPVLCVGAELLNTFTVVRDGLAFVGPHVGDLKNPETEDAFRRGVDHLLDLLRVQPEAVVCDLHPGYRSSLFAAEWERRGVPVLRVQHHEAHAAACMGENLFRGDGLAVALDGVGLGSDGTLWGGELLAGRPGAFRRVGHLAQVPQPGGDRAAEEPWRMAASYLRQLMGPDWTKLPLPALAERTEDERAALHAMMEKGLFSPLTSSCGRLFDAAAAILGFSGRIKYSAQAPMELEALAARGSLAHPYAVAPPQTNAGILLLDPLPIVRELLQDALGGEKVENSALAFHMALAELWALGVEAAAETTRLRDVFLTGGCLQNRLLANALAERLAGKGFRVYHHRDVPPNDGGISYGQAAYAAAFFDKE